MDGPGAVRDCGCGHGYKPITERLQRLHFLQDRSNFTVSTDVPSATSFTLYLPAGGCEGSGPFAVALTELNLFKVPSLKLFGSNGPMADDHFHPCSFSQVC